MVCLCCKKEATGNNFQRVFLLLKYYTMTNIHAYLTFNGNCKEAMKFYKKCLGGTLLMQTVADSPMAGKLPEKMKKSILHSTLTKNGFVLMGSDMVGENGLMKGNSVSLLLNCSSEKEIKNSYKKLSENGMPTHPLEITFRGALFGGLTDRYGNHWLLHFDKHAKRK